MNTILLTGRIGSGKSLVAKYFEQLGAQVIDADQISREVATPDSPAFKQIQEKFGKLIVNKNGELDREKLREIIFDNQDAKKWLEQCLHPRILNNMNTQLKKCSANFVIIMVPLLLEKTVLMQDYDIKVGKTIVVDADEAIQLKRIQSRDNISFELANNMLQAQAPQQAYRNIADIIIENNGSKEALKMLVKQVYHTIKDEL